METQLVASMAGNFSFAGSIGADSYPNSVQSVQCTTGEN
jgi:hypothetical protein